MQAMLRLHSWMLPSSMHTCIGVQQAVTAAEQAVLDRGCGSQNNQL